MRVLDRNKNTQFIISNAVLPVVTVSVLLHSDREREGRCRGSVSVRGRGR